MQTKLLDMIVNNATNGNVALNKSAERSTIDYTISYVGKLNLWRDKLIIVVWILFSLTYEY